MEYNICTKRKSIKNIKIRVRISKIIILKCKYISNCLFLYAK